VARFESERRRIGASTQEEATRPGRFDGAAGVRRREVVQEKVKERWQTDATVQMISARPAREN
jgi:hypothetical protein